MEPQKFVVCDLFYSKNQGDLFLGSMFACLPSLFISSALKFHKYQQHQAIVQPQVNPQDGDLEANFSNKISHGCCIDLKSWSLPSNSVVVGLSCLGFKGCSKHDRWWNCQEDTDKRTHLDFFPVIKLQWLSWWFRFRSVVASLVAYSLITHPTVSYSIH